MNVVRNSMVMLGVASLIGGCATDKPMRTTGPEPTTVMVSVPATATVFVAAPVVEVAQPPETPPQTDILVGAGKPFGTVAADAPKFVEQKSK